MTQKKSEDFIVPEGRRKSVSTQGAERPGGGKEIPVNEQTWQLGLPFVTADDLEAPTTPGGYTVIADGVRPLPASHVKPKAKVKERTAMSATMEEVVEGLGEAFKSVASNKEHQGLIARASTRCVCTWTRYCGSWALTFSREPIGRA